MSKTSSVGSLESAVTSPMEPSIRNVQQQDTEADYPNGIELLRQRSQQLATRLQQTRVEISTKLSNPTDYPLVEQNANQFMRNFVTQSQLQSLPQQRSMPIQGTATVTVSATASASMTSTVQHCPLYQQQQQHQHQQQEQEQQKQQQSLNHHQQQQQQQQSQNHYPGTSISMQLPIGTYPFPMTSYMPMHVQLQYTPPTAVQPQQQQDTSQSQTQTQVQAHQQQQQQQEPHEIKRKRKSRSALKVEVNALKDLVLKLASLSPDVKTHAEQLITQSEVLAQLEWLNLNDAQQEMPNANNFATTVRQQVVPSSMSSSQTYRIDGGMDMDGREHHDQQQQQQQQQQQPQQQPQQQQPQQQHAQSQSQVSPPMGFGEIMHVRLDSEVSNTSSNSAAASGMKQQPAESSVGGQSPRKRNRNRKKRNGKKAQRNVNTELDAMRSYINKIVQQHVSPDQPLPQELIFKGDFGDLEAHAKRLVAAGYGRIVEEEIRVNRKNNRQAFIAMSADRETLERDGIVLLPVARRYAFDGDTVRAFVLNAGAVVSKATDNAACGSIEGKGSLILDVDDDMSEETESQESDDDNVVVIASYNCPKAFVISIVKQTELRQIVGNISFSNPVKLCDNKMFYKFRPFDLRMPMVYIPEANCIPYMDSQQLDGVLGLLFLAHVIKTDCNGHCIAELVQPLGRVGHLDSELKAILFHNNLRDIEPYEERFNEMYAQPAPPITAKDLENRRDMRQSCVFTIDPLTARDLDDALSIERLDDNLYEVGVHISDVSYYLQENSELDNIVKERSTSIYLANEVIHMLPQTLCFRCSLLPGVDKFSFSVFWRMDGDGNQLDRPTFTRSIMNSCCQFAYDHAQKIIDNPGECFTEDDFPDILNGFTVNDIVERITWLHGMASKMRFKRFDNGALTINNTKLRFSLDPLNGEPMGFEVEQQGEANHMIEEFMLLANQAVAKFIHDAYPNIAILRNHPPPLTQSLKSLREKLHSQGFDLDYSSSKALQASMHKLCKEADDPVAMSTCLSQLLMKPMARATYICSEGKTEPSELWHYALSIPIYTHFTSPIRRYPDVMVHRLLGAALNYCAQPERTPEELHHLTKVANDRKYNAKQAGDDSSNFFFKRYISNRQVIYMRAVVMEIFQHMMNVVTLESGHVISINYKMQRVIINTNNVPNFILVAERNLNQAPQKIQFLSVVPIRLIIWDGKLTGFLLTADQRQNGPSRNNRKKQLQQEQQLQQQQHQQHPSTVQQHSQQPSARSNNKSAKNAHIKKVNQQLQTQEQQRLRRLQHQFQQQQQQHHHQQPRMFALRKNSA